MERLSGLDKKAMGDQVAAVIASHLNDDSMRLLPGVTIENGVVTKLDLTNAAVGDTGASALAAGLAGSSLQGLWLRECLNCCSECFCCAAVTPR